MSGFPERRHPLAGPHELMSERFGGDDVVGSGSLSFIEALLRRVVAPREVGRLDKGPCEILVADLGIAFPLLPAVAGVPTLDAARIGRVVADIGKAPDRAGFEQNNGFRMVISGTMHSRLVGTGLSFSLQMGQYLLDYHRVLNAGNHLHRVTAFTAGFEQG
jgi:hypothetical protein